MTTRCPRCGEERALEQFPRDKSKANGRKSLCRVCDNAKSRRQYERNRERRRETIREWQLANPGRPPGGAARFIRAYKQGRPCARCGEIKPQRKMDFHHVDPATKLFPVSLAPTIALARAEMEKCELLCRACHVREHAAARLAAA